MRSSGSSGYEDPAFFRRLFKRTTGLAPGAYRKRFRIPEFARPNGVGLPTASVPQSLGVSESST
jgi:AraC-like DNA-binding protein